MVPVACDVTVPGASDELVANVTRELGGLDALVYAAGLSRVKALEQTEHADWLELFATNVFGAAAVTRAAFPHLLAERSEGRALYLCSDSAAMPYPGLVAYGSSKAALSAYARGFANEVPRLRATEVIVGPTAGTEVANHFEPAAFEEWAPRWFEGGYVRYAMLQVPDVVTIIMDTLIAPAPPPTVMATGADAHPTMEGARNLAGPDQPELGSAISGG